MLANMLPWICMLVTLDTNIIYQALRRSKAGSNMFTKELASMEANKKLSNYWLNYSKNDLFQGFDEVISKVKERKLPTWDIIKKDK